MTAKPKPVPKTAKEILTYFVRHPHAVDSLEGIARWRLLHEAIHRSIRETRHALDWLVAREFLERIAAAGAAPMFRLNSHRLATARRLVRRGRGGGSARRVGAEAPPRTEPT